MQKFSYDHVPTVVLIQLLAHNPFAFFEVRLLLKNANVATHFLYYDETILRDEGIDGEEREIRLEQFSNNYPDCLWIVDNFIQD